RVAYGGVILALGTMLALLTILLFDAIRGPLYPVLASFLAGWVLIAAKYSIPWRWSATMVAAIALVLVVIVFFFVPPLTDALVQSEGLVYLRGQPGQHAIIALEWPLLPLVTAILLDVTLAADNMKKGSLPWFAFLIVLISGLWIPADLALFHRALITRGAMSDLIALVFGVLGAWVGARVGREMGLSLRFVERA
ncbi:MAG TPA: hypothetical protein VKB76_15695, partial [Ktedonobacterales bacterium]|nr:hypothetical protein [Ktedonobacterales bacterium]